MVVDSRAVEVDLPALRLRSGRPGPLAAEAVG
jgi:hypothetical protein